MSLEFWGAVLIGVTVIGCGLYLAYRYLTEMELHRLRETVTFVEPADPQVRITMVSGGIYDHEAEGDFR